MASSDHANRDASASDDSYSDEEAEQRFLTTVRAALRTPPKPQKSMARKGVAAQSKKQGKRKSA